jgi:hypothetical protein
MRSYTSWFRIAGAQEERSKAMKTAMILSVLLIPFGTAMGAQSQLSEFTITTVAGNGTGGYSGDGGPAINAELDDPNGIAVDLAGNLYIAEYLGQRVRKVATNGSITTVAGTGVAGSAAMAAQPQKLYSTDPLGWPWTAKGICILPTPVTVAFAR